MVLRTSSELLRHSGVFLTTLSLPHRHIHNDHFSAVTLTPVFLYRAGHLRSGPPRRALPLHQCAQSLHHHHYAADALSVSSPRFPSSSRSSLSHHAVVVASRSLSSPRLSLFARPVFNMRASLRRTQPGLGLPVIFTAPLSESSCGASSSRRSLSESTPLSRAIHCGSLSHGHPFVALFDSSPRFSLCVPPSAVGLFVAPLFVFITTHSAALLLLALRRQLFAFNTIYALHFFVSRRIVIILRGISETCIRRRRAPSELQTAWLAAHSHALGCIPPGSKTEGSDTSVTGSKPGVRRALYFT